VVTPRPFKPELSVRKIAKMPEVTSGLVEGHPHLWVGVGQATTTSKTTATATAEAKATTKATATTKAKANAGVLRYAQNDNRFCKLQNL
jgi:hypothetical protein